MTSETPHSHIDMESIRELVERYEQVDSQIEREVVEIELMWTVFSEVPSREGFRGYIAELPEEHRHKLHNLVSDEVLKMELRRPEFS
jgi:hypothetical protein